MATATAQPNRAELMFLGKECHHPACHLNDFLPFSCPACNLSFCQPHFLPSHHSCTSPLPPSMRDRIAPKCPLCDETVSSTSSGDPNEAVDRHINSGTCTGLEGGEARKKAELRRKKERGEVCWRRGCAKTLVVQMKCEVCNHLFCPTHRHTSSHTCDPSSTASSSRNPTPQPQPQAQSSKLLSQPTLSRFLPKSNNATASSSRPSQPAAPAASPVVPTTASTTSPLDVRAAAAAAAMKRAGQEVKAPFVKTKTEKRAKDEANSALQSLKVRHEKGLLSKAEELKYAEMVGKKESTRRKGEGKGGKDGCVIG